MKRKNLKESMHLNDPFGFDDYGHDDDFASGFDNQDDLSVILNSHSNAFKKFINNGKSHVGLNLSYDQEMCAMFDDLIDYYSMKGILPDDADVYDEQCVATAAKHLNDYLSHSDTTHTGKEMLVDEVDDESEKDEPHIYDLDRMLQTGNDLHKRKKAYKKVNGGDNPMTLEQKLKELETKPIEEDIDMSTYIKEQGDMSRFVDEEPLTMDDLRQGMPYIDWDGDEEDDYDETEVDQEDALNHWDGESWDEARRNENAGWDSSMGLTLEQKLRKLDTPINKNDPSRKKNNPKWKSGMGLGESKRKEKRIMERGEMSRFVDEEPLTMDDLRQGMPYIDWDGEKQKQSDTKLGETRNKKRSFNITEAKRIEQKLWRKYNQMMENADPISSLEDKIQNRKMGASKPRSEMAKPNKIKSKSPKC